MDIDGIRPAKRRTAPRSLDGIRPGLIAAAPAARTTVAPHATPDGATPPVPPATPPQAAAAGQPPIPPKHYHLPAYQPAKHHQKQKSLLRKRLTWRGIVWRSAVALLAAVLVTGGFLSWQAYSKLHKVFRGTSTAAALSAKPVAPDLLKGEGDGRVNILLLGVGGPGHDGPDLTDTIVVLSVDPVNNTASMLSVPRDLWVKQPVNYFGSYQKINAAYESGKYHTIGHLDASNSNTAAIQAGFDSIDQVVKNVLGISVSYHVLVNFSAFRQAVDTVDGVTIDVPTQLYDPTMAWENHNNPVLAQVGVQQMNGVQALLYARSRETTSDFARSQRQRQILIALKDKALGLGTLSNPAKIVGLMDAFGNNVYSDMSTQAATRLYDITKQINDSQVGSIGLTDEPHKLVATDHVGTTSVVRPVAGFDQYAAIQDYVRSQLLDGYLVKEHASVAVLAPTQTAADAAAATLKTYGYNVTSAGVATVPISASMVIDRSDGSDPYTANYLSEHYGVKPVTALPAGVTLPSADVKFVIMVAK